MNVAILHFHMRRGGVGSVMAKQAACLAMQEDPPRVAFIVGTAPETPVPAPVIVVPGLDYDSFSASQAIDLEAGARELAKGIEEALARAFAGGCDLLHVHNPLLGKNARLLGALGILQERGHALLVQEHDFAEDFRPDVLDLNWPYPGSCDYATINSRDRDRLVAAGLDASQVHLLPNPVSTTDAFSPRADCASELTRGRSLVLYPVRAIRRKNIGEALLLSRFLPEGTAIAITLPPTRRDDLGHYGSWKAMAVRGGYRVRFELGMSSTLPELFDLSFAALTTSVKEGFGYSYLDPLVRGLPVYGREIPHIVGDFAEKGLRYKGLYSGIQVPADALAREALLALVSARLARFQEAYGPCFGKGREEGLEPILEALKRRFEGESLDFGSLDEGSQAAVLESMDRDEGLAAEMLRLNPFLPGLFDKAPGRDEALEQRNAVLGGYSERAYGKALLAAYRHALLREGKSVIDRARLVELFLEPSGFFLPAS
jgi:glycosyltransferase involved in cell wall biosynthesis